MTSVISSTEESATQVEEEVIDQGVDAVPFARFIAAKGGRHVCPVCSTDKWYIVEDEETRGYGLPTRELDGSSDERSVALIALSCQNCGYLIFHMRRDYLIWLNTVDRNGSEDSGASEGSPDV